MELVTGLVVKASSASGLCVAQTNPEIPGQRRQYAFTIDKVRNYDGRDLADIGLSVGTTVRLKVNDDLVEVVDILEGQSR